MAGNGPVFQRRQAGQSEHVTLWTYLTYLGGWIGGPLPGYVALTLALSLYPVLRNLVFLMLGAARLYAPAWRVAARCCCRPAHWSTSPSRRRASFATSGLENGLVLAYLGLLVVAARLLVAGTAQPTRGRRPPTPSAASSPPGVGRAGQDQRSGAPGTGPGRRRCAGHDALNRGAGPAPARVDRGGRAASCPVAYQIFRMGYYTRLFPAHGGGQGRLRVQSGPRAGVPGQQAAVPTCCGSRPVLLIGLGLVMLVAARSRGGSATVAYPPTSAG